MSQLDVSISFSHLFGLIFCFYIFIHYITFLLVKYWYNQKIRFTSIKEVSQEPENLDKTFVLKKILKL